MKARKDTLQKNAAEGYLARASLRNIHVAPRKARLVVNMIRDKNVGVALEHLEYCDKKTGPLLRKLLLAAAANAKEKYDIDVDELVVKRIWVDAGRTLKRWMPRAQGRATPIRKRHSSITVVLDERG